MSEPVVIDENHQNWMNHIMSTKGGARHLRKIWARRGMQGCDEVVHSILLAMQKKMPYASNDKNACALAELEREEG